VFLVEASALLPFAPEAVLAAAGSVESALRWQVGVLGVRRARPGAERAAGGLVVSYYALGTRHPLAARVLRADPPHHFAYRAACAAFTLDVSLDAAATFGGTRLTYRLRLVTPPAADPDAEGRAAALRRLLGRRAPRDLARLEAYVARRAGRFVRRPATRLDATLDALAGIDALGAPPPGAAPGGTPIAPAVPTAPSSET
jgi:hypothetical protein